MVAIVTSLMTPPLLSWCSAGVAQKPEEAARLEREKLLARLPFSREGAKLLVLSGGGPHAHLAAHLAAALRQSSRRQHHGFPRHDRRRAGSRRTGRRRVRAHQGDRGNERRAEYPAAQRQRPIRLRRRSSRKANAATTRSSPAPRRSRATMRSAARCCASSSTSAQAPIVIVRNVGAAVPLRKILAPTTGAPFSRLGATLAMLYAHATGAQDDRAATSRKVRRCRLARLAIGGAMRSRMARRSSRSCARSPNRSESNWKPASIRAARPKTLS